MKNKFARGKFTEQEVIDACSSSLTMAEAASKLGIHFNSFKRYAQQVGAYRPNQAGKGKAKNKPIRISTEDILAGLVPHFHTFSLKERLLKLGIKTNQCEVCSLTEWQGKSLNMELDHIDGKRTNHKLDNLRMICPNCHAQTTTYRSKNRQSK